MKLLLVTGAGASRELGQDDNPLPLMNDWSDALCGALDATERNLASACHLAPGMSGARFEEAIGLLLQWQEVRWLEERFQNLGGPRPTEPYPQQIEARANTDRRLEQVIEVIRRSLYDEFGLNRVDDGKARKAYGALLQRLGAERLVVATTNYDRSVEGALLELGMNVETGFKGRGARSRKLDVAGLVEGSASTGSTPVLHLHGAVGWYHREQDGQVRDYTGDDPYMKALGTPVILYPDPRKDPTKNALVADLWREFAAALKAATHVLIVGHSLHDPALVDAVREAPDLVIGVSVYSETEAESDLAESFERVEQAFPGAIPIPMKFGPDLIVEQATLDEFAARKL